MIAAAALMSNTWPPKTNHGAGLAGGGWAGGAGPAWGRPFRQEGAGGWQGCCRARGSGGARPGRGGGGEGGGAAWGCPCRGGGGGGGAGVLRGRGQRRLLARQVLVWSGGPGRGGGA